MARTTSNPWKIAAISLGLIALVALSALTAGLVMANRSLREVERTPALIAIGRPTQKPTQAQPTTPQSVGSRSVREPERTAAAPRPTTEKPTKTPGTALSSSSVERIQLRETKIPSKKVSARVEITGFGRVEGP
jgi:hypothetical protein